MHFFFTAKLAFMRTRHLRKHWGAQTFREGGRPKLLGKYGARSISYFFLLVIIITTGGCSLFSGADSPTTLPLAPTRTPLPTFTATPIVQPPTPAPTATPTSLLPTPVAVAPAAAPLTTTVALTTTSSLPITPTVAVATEPRLTVVADAANIRSGPDTSFGSIGAAVKGESFQLLARNAAGSWWQVCCVNGQPGWIFGELVTVVNAETLAVAADIPTPVQPTPALVAESPTPAPQVAAPPPPASSDPSAGDFTPDAMYKIVHFKVLGLNENNGGIRDSRAQHHIFLTVLDQNGNGLDGVVVENLVGEKGQIVTGSKGPGKAEIAMYYEPFKFRVASDPTGIVTSQTSNQMGLAFPHLPDIVGKLGGLDYEYAVCPTIDIKCAWPIQAVHFSYEITFQKVK